MEYLPKEVATVCKTDLENFSQRKRVGSYLLGETIGEGSFAKVKIAIHVSTGEKVAIKIINKRKAREDRYVSRHLKREAEIMQLIRHKNVVRLLEVMETDAFYYLVTELCSGGELLDVICERKYFDEDTTRRYIQQLVSAVSVMHKSGIVHRDLKIENFLLDEDDNLKIVDFGLSNVLPPAALETWERIGMCPLLLTTHCGSPAYAAPELLAQESYGAQVDVWSIGVNMFAMLTGNLPYTMEPFSIIDLYHKMMERRMTSFPKRISQGARDLIMQFLDPIPQKRITLQQAANHPWLRGSSQPATSCVKAADSIEKQVNQNIILHIAENMGMNMKELVNSVTENRASHSFAIYFLLNQRLRRFEERKSEKANKEKHSFSKLKVIKKAKLPTDNTSGPRSKFTYKGMKIATNSTSQPRLQEQRSRSSTQHEHVSNTREHKEACEQWNQYATFPRDRRTTNSKDNNNIVTIGNASLDRGSDDIDYQRVSSPESTDTSASSLELPHALHDKLLDVKGNSLSTQLMSNARHASSTGESGSEDEYCSRSRSKSLTSSEEYDHSKILLSAYCRNRTSSMANCFHHNFIETSPRKKQHSRIPNRCVSPICSQYSKNTTIQETAEVLRMSHQSHIESETEYATHKEFSVKDSTSIISKYRSNKENIDEKRNNDFVNKERVVQGLLTLRKTSLIDDSKFVTPSKGSKARVLREVIPPPTPFKDDSATIKFEQLEAREVRTESKRKGMPSDIQRKEVVAEKQDCKSKKTSKRRNHRKSHEKTKSLSDISFDSAKPVNFQKIEVEKVKRIELVPLKNPTMQIAPTLHTMSPFSLNCVKQESPFNPDSFSQQLKVTTEPDISNERTFNEPGTADKPKLLRADSLKQEECLKRTPFKVDVVKLAKWQRVPVMPVFRAEFVMNHKVTKCTAGPAMPLKSTARNSNEQRAHAEDEMCRADNTTGKDETIFKKGQLKVNRTRSCSAADYTQTLEKDTRDETRRNERRRPRLRSRTSEGEIVVKRGSSVRTGNVFMMNDYKENKDRYHEHSSTASFNQTHTGVRNINR